MKKKNSPHLAAAGRRLKAARATADMTQDDVAAAMGVSPSAVCRWEKNIDDVNFGDVIRICKLLNIKVSELEN